MIRIVTRGLSAILLATLAWAQPADAPRVTLKAIDEPVAQVAAELGEQIGAQVGLLGPCPATVSLTVQEATPEEAVAKLAEALGASWGRAYLLESQPPAQPWPAEDLFKGLENQRNRWLESLNETQRQGLLAMVALSSRPPQGEGPKPPPLPGGARASQAPAQDPFSRARMDPVQQLLLPHRADKIALNLDNQPLEQSLYAFATASGFFMAAGADLAGEVTIHADQQPVEDVVEAIAAAAGAQWRKIYLMAVPREMSEAEFDETIKTGLAGMMQRYWARPPGERAAEVGRWVERLGRWGQMAQQRGEDGQPNLITRGLQQLGPRAMSHLQQYSSSLSMEQRRELLPIVRALGQAINQAQ